ncbi:MAG: antibiotic biosynthesis monooxygenase [Pseudomonadota bacterium]|nr:antibiotic biosynthesis monooxygenase [Pseudomonadota bacterium]
MLVCLIEFGTLPGMAERNKELVTNLLVHARKHDGFISKETFTSRDNPEKVVTMSYWRDAESLRRWMRHEEHLKTIPIGRNELFSHYSIQVAEIVTDKNWRKPDTSASSPAA